MKIASGGIRHETNTFSIIPTGLAQFRQAPNAPGILLGADIPHNFAGTRTEQGAFWQVAAAERWDLVPTLWANATPSGLVTREAFDYLLGGLLSRLREAGPVAAVLLDLHGAMAAEGCEDAEGAILAAVRAVVGERVPVVATLDLHANITAAMAGNADALIGYDTYPHVDAYERGLEAAHLLAAVLRGEARLAMALRKLPLLTAPTAHRTGRDPMISLFAQAHAMEKEEGLASVTLAAGFPFADVADAGFSVVVVVADGDRAKATRKADEMAAAVWARRRDFTAPAVPVREAVARAMAAPAGPVVLADQADNPGGGGPADGTAILAALLQAGAQGAVVVPLADPAAVAAAIAAGVGQQVTLRVGGKTDDRHGSPLDVAGYVRLIADGRFVQRGPMGTGMRMNMGRTVVLVCGGVEIVLTEKALQPTDLAMLRAVAIEPAERKILVLKSAVHYRAAFEPIAREIIEVDSPGIHSPRLESYTFHNLRRPIFPLDEM